MRPAAPCLCPPASSDNWGHSDAVWAVGYTQRGRAVQGRRGGARGSLGWQRTWQGSSEGLCRPCGHTRTGTCGPLRRISKLRLPRKALYALVKSQNLKIVSTSDDTFLQNGSNTASIQPPEQDLAWFGHRLRSFFLLTHIDPRRIAPRGGVWRGCLRCGGVKREIFFCAVVKFAGGDILGGGAGGGGRGWDRGKIQASLARPPRRAHSFIRFAFPRGKTSYGRVSPGDASSSEEGAIAEEAVSLLSEINEIEINSTMPERASVEMLQVEAHVRPEKRWGPSLATTASPSRRPSLPPLAVVVCGFRFQGEGAGFAVWGGLTPRDASPGLRLRLGSPLPDRSPCSALSVWTMLVNMVRDTLNVGTKLCIGSPHWSRVEGKS